MKIIQIILDYIKNNSYSTVIFTHNKSTVMLAALGGCDAHFTPNLKCQPHGGARGEVRGSSK